MISESVPATEIVRLLETLENRSTCARVSFRWPPKHRHRAVATRDDSSRSARATVAEDPRRRGAVLEPFCVQAINANTASTKRPCMPPPHRSAQDTLPAHTTGRELGATNKPQQANIPAPKENPAGIPFFRNRCGPTKGQYRVPAKQNLPS